MEKINGLLKALGNKVPASIAKRLDGLQKLNQKLASARSEHEANPTEESQEALDEIFDFISDTQEDLVEDLSVLVEQKIDLEAKAQAQEQEARKRAQAKASVSREKQELAVKEEKERQEAEEEALKLSTKTETEKKSGTGWGTLLLGGILLVATGGAIRYFGNRK